MIECECTELELSAVVDGVGDPAVWLELLDHLVECPSCQEFYRQARSLDAMVGAAGRLHAVQAPPAVWQRIARETAMTRAVSLAGRSGLRWTLRVAAALVVGLGLWAAGMLRLPATLTVRDGMEVTVGEDSGRLTDAQFVDLAVSVLRADRKYREKMLEILTAVDSAGPSEQDRTRNLRRAVTVEDPASAPSGRFGDRYRAQYW